MKLHVSCVVCGYSKEATFMVRATTGKSRDWRNLQEREKLPEVVICDQCLEVI